MEAKISMQSNENGVKKALTIELKQVSHKAAGSIVFDTICGFFINQQNVEPLQINTYQMNENIGQADIEVMPITTALEEASDLSNFPDLKLTSLDEQNTKVEVVPSDAEVSAMNRAAVKENIKQNLKSERLQDGLKQNVATVVPPKRKQKPYKQNKNKVYLTTDLTEKVIEVTPILELRKLVSHTPWMFIPGYSKMGAKELRIQMKKALFAYRESQAQQTEGDKNHEKINS